MCGRYALHLRPGEVRSQVESQTGRQVAWEDEDDYNPDRGYNIPPRSRNPIVLRGGGGVGEVYDESHKQDDGGIAKDHQAPARSPGKSARNDLKIECMQWGLVPHWMKRQPDSASTLKTINARDDTIMEGSSMWKSIRGRKRCIVVAEGFFEWLKKGTDRVPHHVKRSDGKLMCFAGLWDSVTYEGESKSLRTYTVVTTNSNKQLNFLHDRMPVILDGPKDIETWLDTSSGNWSKELSDLLKPFEGELDCYIVPKEVGKVGNQSADFLKPIAERKGNISSFFAKSSQSTVKNEKKDSQKSPSPAAGKDTKPISSQGQSQSDTKDKASAKVVNEDELALNPDEADKVKPSPAAKTGRPSSKGKQSAEAIVLDEESAKPKTGSKGQRSRKGKKDKPIVLESSSEDEKQKKASAPTNSKRKRSPDTVEAESKPASKRAAKGAKGSQEGDTDGEGNEKLTNFFEVKDDE